MIGKFLRVATLAGLLIAQQGAALDALAQTMSIPAAASAAGAGEAAGAFVVAPVAATQPLAPPAMSALPPALAAGLSAPTAAEPTTAAAAPSAIPAAAPDAKAGSGSPARSGLTAYLVRAGRAPVVVSLDELSRESVGEFASAFDSNGHLRVILNEGNLKGSTLTKDDVEKIKKILHTAGLRVDDGRARTETLRVDEPARAAAPAGLPFLRELPYLWKTLKSSFNESGTPRWNEIAGGVAGKIVPAFVNIGILATTYKAHPAALVLAASLSLAVETFHGVWVNAWDTFQSKIGRQRGMIYQNLFNFAYGQMISGSYRAIGHFSLPNVAAPWSVEYWKDMSVMTVIGTFVGTLGYRGLNSLYEKGRVPRWGRASIQQLRDFCGMMIGPFFGAGNMAATWALFGAMQAVDLVIFMIDKNTDTRPIVYVADESVAKSAAYQKILAVDRQVKGKAERRP